MSLTLPKACSMGGSQTGLVGTIGVTLLNSNGTVNTARATAGIFEIGGGCYGKDIVFADDFKGSIKWDTGGGAPRYAVEDFFVDGKVDSIYDICDTGFTNISFASMFIGGYLHDLETIRQTISGDGKATSTITRTA